MPQNVGNFDFHLPFCLPGRRDEYESPTQGKPQKSISSTKSNSPDTEQHRKQGKIIPSCRNNRGFIKSTFTWSENVTTVLLRVAICLGLLLLPVRNIHRTQSDTYQDLLCVCTSMSQTQQRTWLQTLTCFTPPDPSAAPRSAGPSRFAYRYLRFGRRQNGLCLREPGRGINVQSNLWRQRRINPGEISRLWAFLSISAFELR